MKVRKAIIPAAGMGTRVLPASKAVPKEMLNIVDKPAIQKTRKIWRRWHRNLLPKIL